MLERRANHRNRAFLAGSVSFRGGRGPIDCVVRDVTEGGALLLLDEPQRAPSRMELAIPQRGGSRSARVVWRGASAVGVAFAAEDAPAEAPSGTPERGGTVVSLDAARRARRVPDDAALLAERVARVTAPPAREKPWWASPTRQA